MTLRTPLVVVAVALCAPAASAFTYECAASPQATHCSGVLVDGSGLLISKRPLLLDACPAEALIVDANVSLKIAHQSVGDLSAVLVHPDGTRVQLLERPGLARPCDGDDVDARFSDKADAGWERCEYLIPSVSGELAPLTPLAALDGKPRRGEWTLEASDHKGGAFGALLGWSLHLPCALPLVTVEAVDASAREKAGEDALFRITRTGDPVDALVVRLDLSGTAVVADYQPLPATLTLAAGQLSVDVPLVAVVDDEFETDETVTLSAVVPGHDPVGDPATVTIAADGCGDGKVDPGEACDDANDVDGDGCQITCQMTLYYVADDCTCGGTGGTVFAAFGLLALMRRRRG